MARITGDGALGLNIQELETASRLQLPIVFVVLNDCAWGMIRAGQTLFYSRRHIGVDFSDIRYDEIAKGMNCYGERVVEPSQIKPALQRAVDSRKTAVLDVRIDRRLYRQTSLFWLQYGLKVANCRKRRRKPSKKWRKSYNAKPSYTNFSIFHVEQRKENEECPN